MEQYVGLDVSLKLTAISIVDRTGKIEREGWDPAGAAKRAHEQCRGDDDDAARGLLHCAPRLLVAAKCRWFETLRYCNAPINRAITSANSESKPYRIPFRGLLDRSYARDASTTAFTRIE
jgi:hypothetical protein